MKKKRIIIMVSIFIILLGIGGLYIYFTMTPEYSLLQAAKDVKELGIDGLEEHVTKEIWETIENVREISSNPIIAWLISKISSKSDTEEMMENLSKFKIGVDDIMKGKKHSEVVLAFEYGDKINGTISIVMKKEGKKWLISGLDNPNIGN